MGVILLFPNQKQTFLKCEGISIASMVSKNFLLDLEFSIIQMGKKQTSRNQLDDHFEVEGSQTYARSLGPRGNHQHEVEFTDGSKKLVTLPPRFRNVVWLKRGSFCF
jgi:hypothetical protein